MAWVIVGSQQWIDWWAKWYWERACKSSNYLTRPYLIQSLGETYLIEQTMYYMFLSLQWESTEPWAKGK